MARVCPACRAEYGEAERFCSRDGVALEPERQVETGQADPDSLLGLVLNDRVRLVKQLGIGGMGMVYLAVHDLLQRKLAVKFVRRELTGSATLAKRFMREAQLASRIDDPHVVSVLDFGRTAEGHYYLVMEYLTGRGLHQVLEVERTLAVPRALAIARQIALGLAAAHSWGVVHRDLKPHNVWLVEHRGDPDFVKVLDFGLAKAIGSVRDTATGEMVGTPYYIAPEQITNRDVDHRADLYGLGCVLYELLVGRPPFLGTLTQILMGHSEKVPDRPSHKNREVTPALDELVLRCLHKDRDERFHDAPDLIAAVDALGVLPGPLEPVRVRRTSASIEVEETLPGPATSALLSPVPGLRHPGRQTGLHALAETPVEVTTQQSGSNSDLQRLWYRMLVDLVECRWPDGAAPRDVQRLLSEQRRLEAELEDRQTEVALVSAEVEDLELSTRRREAQLRQALVDLGVDRTRLQEQMAALEARDGASFREWRAGEEMHMTTGEIQLAAVEAHGSLRDVGHQISELERRISEIHVETRAQQRMREQVLALRREQVATLERELWALLRKLRERAARDAPSEPGLVRRTIDALERIESKLERGTSPPPVAVDPDA